MLLNNPRELLIAIKQSWWWWWWRQNAFYFPDHENRSTRSNRDFRSHLPLHDRDKPQTQIGRPRDFFNLDLSYNSSAYPNLDNSYSHGLVPYNNTGNDDSTTTSGSYVLDPEEEIKEVIQPSNRCIVWAEGEGSKWITNYSLERGNRKKWIWGENESVFGRFRCAINKKRLDQTDEW